MKTKWIILLSITCFLTGIWMGRKTSEQQETKTIAGSTVSGSYTIPKLNVEFQLPKIGNLYVPHLIIRDTVIFRDTVKEVIRIVDTLASYRAAVEDWNRERSYQQTLFNDLNGKMDIDLSVRFNELQRVSYTFAPIAKETTILKKRVFMPFVTASYSTLKYAGIGGGIFYYNVGVSWKYNFGDKTYSEIGIYYKF